MSRDEQPQHIPVDPQEFLTLIEQFGNIRDEYIQKELYVMLMLGISETIAAMDFEDSSTELSSQWFLERNRAWLEYAFLEVPGVVQSEEAILRMQTELSQAVDRWVSHRDASGGKRRTPGQDS